MNIDDIRTELYKCHLHYNHCEMNFISSQVDTMACFLNLPETYHSAFVIADMHYNPIFYMETNAYIYTCSISCSGKYAIFRTARSPFTDSNKHFFINVEKRELLWGTPTESNSKTVNGYFIDESKRLIFEHHEDYKILYNFEGDFLNKKEWLSNRMTHSDSTFYELIDNACNLMKKYMSGNSETFEEKLIINSLKGAENKGVSSEYQLGIAYKLLGDLYSNLHNNEKALYAYKKGLSFYPKLPIKRIIKNLENQ